MPVPRPVFDAIVHGRAGMFIRAREPCVSVLIPRSVFRRVSALVRAREVDSPTMMPGGAIMVVGNTCGLVSRPNVNVNIVGFASTLVFIVVVACRTRVLVPRLIVSAIVCGRASLFVRAGVTLIRVQWAVVHGVLGSPEVAALAPGRRWWMARVVRGA